MMKCIARWMMCLMAMLLIAGMSMTANPVLAEAVNPLAIHTSGMELITKQGAQIVVVRNDTGLPITWKSSNTRIAKVNAGGYVTAVKAGRVTITATDGFNIATCDVSVRNLIVPKSIRVSATKLTMYPGDSFQLLSTINPAYVDNSTITWKSSKGSVAQVSSTGFVTAHSPGTAKITVTTQSGGRKSTCTVTVKPIIPTAVYLDNTNVTMTKGATVRLWPTVVPSNASNMGVSWKTSNKKVATVSSSGVVTAKGNGTATITVTTKSGSKRAVCTISVPVAPTSVKMTQTNVTLSSGEQRTLGVEVGPNTASDKSVTWASTNNAIATVSGNGTVTALSSGSATIVARTNVGNLMATCTITVTSAPKGIPMYRALLIGQEAYSPKLQGPRRDVNTISNALRSGGYSEVYEYYDRSAAGIESAITSLYSKGIASSDITLFYYSGHGVNSSNATYKGALSGIDGNIVTTARLRALLDNVPGTVIVMLDSCLSGAFVKEGSKGITDSDLAAYNKAIVSEFSPVLLDPKSGGASKYKIMTAASADGLSYSTTCFGSGFSGVFTYFLGCGSGWEAFSGWMGLDADANYDRALTLTELYNYVKSNVDSFFSMTRYSQATQIWPAGDSFVVLSR